jgi:hypothetical protein
MGASHSIASDHNRTLPTELIIDILSCLALHDLTSCHRVNRHLNDIINSSERLQHKIDTAVAGVVDNPNSTLSLLERRDAFARRQKAWDTCQPQRTTSATKLFPDEVSNGTCLRLLPLRQQGLFSMAGVAVSVDVDLIAVGIW